LLVKLKLVKGAEHIICSLFVLKVTCPVSGTRKALLLLEVKHPIV